MSTQVVAVAVQVEIPVLTPLGTQAQAAQELSYCVIPILEQLLLAQV
jgi:hypothetical protein